jgi:TRAP-type C4-dicarboxylate transport system substrate-binding protein
MRATRSLPALTVLAAAACAVGCAGLTHDRAGGSTQAKPVVLTLASHDTGADAREWIAAVQRLSGGSVRIAQRPDWRDPEVDYERDTIADVRAGKVDLALIPARAYDTLGVNSFQALLAPLLVDSYPVEHRVLTSQLPGPMLAGAARLGVVGVAALPGALQYVLSMTHPLLRPLDYAIHGRTGWEIGVRPSRLTTATFRALGGGTIAMAPGTDRKKYLSVEENPSDIWAFKYEDATQGESLARNMTLWPRVMTVVMNRDAYGRLPAAQRRALVGAASAATGPAVQRIERVEGAAMRRLCRVRAFHQDVNLLTATPTDLRLTRHALQPVYAELMRDPATAAGVTEIRAIRRTTAPASAVHCPREHPLPVGALAGQRYTAEMTRTGRRRWSGHITIPGLGTGQIDMPGARILFRSFTTGMGTAFHARFPRGHLLACGGFDVSPARRGYRWTAVAAITRASASLHRYLGLTLRFDGFTAARDLTKVRAVMTTDDPPTGLWC